MGGGHWGPNCNEPALGGPSLQKVENPCFRSLQTIMQNYYIRIEDMPSLVSHQLSIIKYVVLKKIFFFLCFDRLISTWTWTWTRTSLDSDLTRTRTSLDLDLSWTRQRWT